MNPSCPARRLVTRCLPVSQSMTPLPAHPCRQFHSSIQAAARPRRTRVRFTNRTAKELGLTSPEKLDKWTKEKFPDATPQQMEDFARQYTPEQMEALKLGEQAIEPKHLAIQGRLRDDPYRFDYLDDFAEVQPIIDVKPEREIKPKKWKFLDEKDFLDQVVTRMVDNAISRIEAIPEKTFEKMALERVKNLPEGQEEVDLTKEEFSKMESDPALQERYLDKPLKDKRQKEEMAEIDETKQQEMMELMRKELNEMLESKGYAHPDALFSQLFPEERELDFTTSAVAPALGKVPGVEGLYKDEADPEDQGLDDSGEYKQLKRMTGLTVKDILSVYTRVLAIRFVHNQTRLGKVRSASVFAIAGNGNGRLGVGSAKSTDSNAAMAMAQMLAVRNMRPIRRYENRTIFGNVQSKVSGTVVELRSRPPGFGLRVSHRIFEMCRAAGIHDLSAVIPRSRNPMNTIKACYRALLNQPDPEEIAIGRGKKLVDVRKVYYGGNVH